MSEVKDILVQDFLYKERENLVEIEELLRLSPMPYHARIKVLEKILLKGVKFGVQKGIFLEEERRIRIEKAKQRSLDKFVHELVFDLNDIIAEHQNNPKVKYSKQKYKLMKQPRQLDLWEQFGLND